MATYTMELYRAVEVSPDGDIGLNQYQIWDENYRSQLNSKIINHYHNREIGLETVDMFRFAMRRRMAEIMPFYNDLYKTTKLDFDPLSTIDIKTLNNGVSTSESTGTSVSETNTTNTSGSRAVNSQMPQNMLSGQGDYATSAADTNSQSSGGGTGQDTSEAATTDNTTNDSRTSGYQGVASDLVMRYRDSLLNVDLMIVGELSDLFMMVWGNADSYTPQHFTRLDSL